MVKITITKDGYKCQRCKHKWVARKKTEPIICPKCKSPYWNKERKKKDLNT